VSSLTQPSSFASAGNFSVQTEREEEMARKIVQAKEQARKAEEQAKTMTKQFVMANTKLCQMEDDLRMVKEQLVAMMDRQCGDLPLVQVRFTPLCGRRCPPPLLLTFTTTVCEFHYHQIFSYLYIKFHFFNNYY